MSKGTIVWLSDSPLTCTGYATISKNILNGLTKKGWKCIQLAHNYIGQPLPPPIHFKDGTSVDYEIIGMGLQQYSQDLIEPTIQKEKADIFCILLDTFMLYPWVLNMNFAPARSVFYFPSDGGGGLPLGCDNILRKMNSTVAMAKFGQRQVKEVHNLDVNYIPHAVDPEVYKPLSESEKLACKAKFGLSGKYVVGVVARNQGRKMLDRTIKAFSLLAPKYPDMVLFLHTDPFDGAQVFPILEMVKRYNLENRVMFSGMRYFNGFEFKEMNEVYNAMDVFFLTTSGEGFGIPIIEAMSCEVPVVATDYTTTHELIEEDGKCGESARLLGEITGSWMVERGIMDCEDAVSKIGRLHDNPHLARTYGKVGREKVLKYYNWDKIIDDWDYYFTRLMNK